MRLKRTAIPFKWDLRFHFHLFGGRFCFFPTKSVNDTNNSRDFLGWVLLHFQVARILGSTRTGTLRLPIEQFHTYLPLRSNLLHGSLWGMIIVRETTAARAYVAAEHEVLQALRALLWDDTLRHGLLCTMR